MKKLNYINKAEFDLFGPNILNDKRIRELISEFHPTDTDGIIITLKNYLNGLKTDTEEFKSLVSYLLRGGGKGVFKGKDNRDNEKTIKTESKHEKISVSQKLNQESSLAEINMVRKEIERGENRNNEYYS